MARPPARPTPRLPKGPYLGANSSNVWRNILLGGSKQPADPNPTWLGYSAAKWEGDTLVADTDRHE